MFQKYFNFLSNVQLCILFLILYYIIESCFTPALNIKSNLSLCSRHCAPGNTAPFEETSQRWRAVGNTASDLTGPRFKPQPPATETNALPLDQLAGLH